jgi:hypothetical protein
MSKYLWIAPHVAPQWPPLVIILVLTTATAALAALQQGPAPCAVEG